MMASARPYIESQLLEVLRNFLEEMGSSRAAKRVSLLAQFEYDLGLGSLDRVEFFHRVEELFECHLPLHTYATASTLNDLVSTIEQCAPKQKATRKIKKEPIASAHGSGTMASTLVDSLISSAEKDADRPHIYLQQEEGPEKIITYGALYEGATQVAKGLLERGLKPHDTVAIMLPTCEDFFSAFFGILLAGGIPVPIYPPFRPNRIEEYVQHEATILRSAGIKFLITFPEAEKISYLIHGFIPSMKAIVTVPTLQQSRAPLKHPLILPSDPAFIQYTSGSTGNPKGALLKHSNIIANLESIKEAIQLSPTDRVVSWLPLYHDMGLIGCWLGSLYFRMPLILSSPLTFLSRPERWLWNIHTHQATLSAAPNFAFELCVQKIKEADLEGLDLSSLRLVFNGAEPVQAKTLRRFSKKFSPYGLRPDALYPVYGLAESTVALTFPPLGRAPKIDRILRDTLERQGLAIKIDTPSIETLEIVSCGNPIPEHSIKIVDEKGSSLPERQVGALWFRGPSSMQEYYRNPDATKAIYHGDWLDSGDFAYIAEGEVFITGRKKDIIIKAGRNIYPQDIEELTSRIAGVRKGCVIAFGIIPLDQGVEKLIVVAETIIQEKDAREAMIQEIIGQITSEMGLPPDEVILVPPGTIPKTSSGKLQRSACKATYIKNKFSSPRLPVWLQVIKLFFKSYGQKIRTLLIRLLQILYTGYAGALFLTFFSPLFLLTVAVASRHLAQQLIRVWLKIYCRLVGWWIDIEGKENLIKQEPLIFVSNHASYLDTLILTSILPAGVAFVGKRELIQSRLIGWLIKKLDHLTIERSNVSQSLVDLSQMEERLQRGQSLLIFPEGTFTYVVGLRPFKLGAFKLAAETGISLCPIAISGTRQILPDESYLLRPKRVKIRVSHLIAPQKTDWSEVLRLRSLVRNEIAQGCSEPLFNDEDA
jgi:fatty-acyl-CoA synthase